MRNSRYILTLFGICLCISALAQKGRIFIAAKPLPDGRFVSRIITLDSAETQRLNGSSIIYQRFENKKLAFEKILRPESGEMLRSLAIQKNNFYLDEMTEIYFNEEGYPLDIFCIFYPCLILMVRNGWVPVPKTGQYLAGIVLSDTPSLIVKGKRNNCLIKCWMRHSGILKLLNLTRLRLNAAI